MKHSKLIAAATFVAMGFTGSALASSLTDPYDSYVTFDEIQAVPSGRTASEARMADIYDPYILSHEIVVSKGCTNPAADMIADPFNSFFTFAELEKAEMSKKC